MSEIKLQQERGRGAHAEQLLNDDLLKGAFAEIETGIVAKWKNSKDTAERERLHLMLLLLANLIARLNEHVTTGKMAETQLADIEAKRRWFNRKAS